jgi:hypothetical protein
MPDESMVVTPERSSRTLVLPALTALLITSRSCVSPEPIVILPCKAMISTLSTVRLVAFMVRFSFFGGNQAFVLAMPLPFARFFVITSDVPPLVLNV